MPDGPFVFSLSGLLVLFASAPRVAATLCELTVLHIVASGSPGRDTARGY